MYTDICTVEGCEDRAGLIFRHTDTFDTEAQPEKLGFETAVGVAGSCLCLVHRMKKFSPGNKKDHI